MDFNETNEKYIKMFDDMIHQFNISQKRMFDDYNNEMLRLQNVYIESINKYREMIKDKTNI